MHPSNTIDLEIEHEGTTDTPGTTTTCKGKGKQVKLTVIVDGEDDKEVEEEL
jgi:hypothetical protein